MGRERRCREQNLADRLARFGPRVGPGGIGHRGLVCPWMRTVSISFTIPLRAVNSPQTESAVLILVYRDAAQKLRLVLVVRGRHGLHGGQLGLPGGKAEPSDASSLETALRETEEEIGLQAADIEVLATLEPLESRTTGFRVHPFLARVRDRPDWRLREGEITGILTPAVDELTNPGARRRGVLSFPTWPEPREVDLISLDGGNAVWGLTLRLLDAVLPRLLAGEWTV